MAIFDSIHRRILTCFTFITLRLLPLSVSMGTTPKAADMTALQRCSISDSARPSIWPPGAPWAQETSSSSSRISRVYQSFKVGYVRAGRHVLERCGMRDVDSFLSDYEEYAQALLQRKMNIYLEHGWVTILRVKCSRTCRRLS